MRPYYSKIIFARIRHGASSLPITLTLKHLFRAVTQLAIYTQMSFHGIMVFARHLTSPAIVSINYALQNPFLKRQSSYSVAVDPLRPAPTWIQLQTRAPVMLMPTRGQSISHDKNALTTGTDGKVSSIFSTSKTEWLCPQLTLDLKHLDLSTVRLANAQLNVLLPSMPNGWTH